MLSSSLALGIISTVGSTPFWALVLHTSAITGWNSSLTRGISWACPRRLRLASMPARILEMDMMASCLLPRLASPSAARFSPAMPLNRGM
jgi:hypothetical protein